MLCDTLFRDRAAGERVFPGKLMSRLGLKSLRARQRILRKVPRAAVFTPSGKLNSMQSHITDPRSST